MTLRSAPPTRSPGVRSRAVQNPGRNPARNRKDPAGLDPSRDTSPGRSAITLRPRVIIKHGHSRTTDRVRSATILHRNRIINPHRSAIISRCRSNNRATTSHGHTSRRIEAIILANG